MSSKLPSKKIADTSTDELQRNTAHQSYIVVSVASDVILPVKYAFGFFYWIFTVFLPTSCKLFSFVYKQCFSALVVWQLANYL